MPGAVVQVEAVRVRPLLHRDHAVLGPVHDSVVLAKLGDDLEAVAHLPDHPIERPLLRRIDVHGGPRLVVRHVQVEVAVAIYVGQRHGHAAAGRAEPGLRGPLGEHAVPIVDEQRHAPAERADEQVQVAVAVDVGEDGAGREAPRHRDARLGRDVLEAPVAQIAVQGVRALVARQVNVGKPVSIHVAQGDPAALRQVAVPEGAVEGNGIGESNPGPGWRQLDKARPAAAGHIELMPASSGLFVPDWWGRRTAARPAEQHQREPRSSQGTAHPRKTNRRAEQRRACWRRGATLKVRYWRLTPARRCCCVACQRRSMSAHTCGAFVTSALTMLAGTLAEAVLLGGLLAPPHV